MPASYLRTMYFVSREPCTLLQGDCASCVLLMAALKTALVGQFMILCVCTSLVPRQMTVVFDLRVHICTKYEMVS